MNEQTNTIEIQVPFSGFYESWHSASIDRVIEQESDDENSSYLNQDTINDIDYSKLHKPICELYIQAYNNAFKDCYNIDLKLEYSRLTSPRFYNFETDRLYCNVSVTALDEAFKLVDKVKLKEQLKQNFSPRSGFIPFSDTLQAIQEMDLVFFACEALESLLSEDEVLNEFYHYSDNITHTIIENIPEEFWINKED